MSVQPGSHSQFAKVDAALADQLPWAVNLLAQLVAEASTVGQEAGAQQVLAMALAESDFRVETFPLPDDIAADPAAGVVQTSYEGRYNLVAQRGAGDRSLLLNGHIDVVPATDTRHWDCPPFGLVEEDGWLVGRGAGDMKAGFVIGLLAVRALDIGLPDWLDGRLTVVAAIEEECTGNGTLASVRAGHVADAALLLEPTDLRVLLGGIALTWIDVDVEGLAGHAEAAGRSHNAILAAGTIIDALRHLEQRMNSEHRASPDPAFADLDHPYNVNVGVLESGDWPSSVPASARLRVRVGHPGRWTSEQTLTEVEQAIKAVTPGDDWLAAHPPRLRLTGFRAERHFQSPDTDLVRRLAAAHHAAHAAEPALVTMGSTTDARFYLNQAGIPAVAYGARTRNIHGSNEAVEVASIAAAARTLTRFVADWFSR